MGEEGSRSDIELAVAGVASFPRAYVHTGVNYIFKINFMCPEPVFTCASSESWMVK